MYYYHDGDNEVGPFGADKLNKLASAGLVRAGTLIRAADSGAWVPFAQLELGDIPQNSQNSRSQEDIANAMGVSTLQRKLGAVELNDVEKWKASRESNVKPDVAESKVSQTLSSDGWLAYPHTPWRRYAARMLDTTLNGVIAFALIGIAFYAVAPATAEEFFSIFEGENAAVLNLMATTVAASILGGLMIGASGFTLGKWIFGVKVTRLDETKLGVRAGFSRDFNVLVNGLVFGIPILALFTMWSAYSKLRDNKPASWDEGKYVVWHRPSGTSQYFLNAVGILLMVLIFILVSALGAV